MMRAVAIAALALFAVACGSDDEPSDTTTAPTADTASTGIANPASEFCVAQGGTVEIETADDGSEVGYCVLPDGSRVDEWEYFRSEGGSTDSTDG